MPYDQHGTAISYISVIFQLIPSVPTFDGRKPFKLPLFKTLPALNSELTIASVVLVAFSLGAYSLGDGAALVAGANLGVSLNIQAVVLLADPNPLVPDPSDTSLTSNTPLLLDFRESPLTDSILYYII